ncbi:Pimeloyl-ACP methyl ester carboxylesterase [Peribacillus simplex]|uniref:Pimeloyl-ACP methyl ester carboxylesterase n=1 Tax=Peribacillus simplex TaxID=1478 RepID=A0A9X8WLG8_9BACI|nr:alpha/beta hydrolase [Peribacillus simplex]SIR68222.1 Pimeloyl-ACP methyl ester carboxylesterase [Peribacillus simplex]
MDLHFEITGSGHPVVLIHGGGADLRQWTFLASLLSKDYKVIAFDGRGAGKSPSPIKHANYVDDVLALMDYLELKQATIIGHSMGGQIATDFALNYPERVSKLVLIAPSLTGFPYSKEFEQYHDKILKSAPNIDKMLALALHSQTYQVVIDSPYKDLAVQMLRHHFGRMLKWPADFCMIWPQPPAMGRLKELNPETLFFIGKKDLADNFRVADCFRKVPNIRFIELEDADHMLPLTHFEVLYQEFTAFMED